MGIAIGAAIAAVVIGGGIYLWISAKRKYNVNKTFGSAVSGTKGVVDDVKKSLNG